MSLLNDLETKLVVKTFFSTGALVFSVDQSRTDARCNLYSSNNVLLVGSCARQKSSHLGTEYLNSRLSMLK